MRFSIGCVVKMWSMSAPGTSPVSVITRSSRLRAECIVLLQGGGMCSDIKSIL